MTSHEDKRQRSLHMEDQDADRRQVPQSAPAPQTPGEGEGAGYSDLPPGEEAGGVGEETQGGPMQHQGVGPGDPHTGGDRPHGNR